MCKDYHKGKLDNLADILAREPIDLYLRNVRTKVSVYNLDGMKVPATITDTISSQNCYAVSPYALIISYCQVELNKLDNKILIFLIKFALLPLSQLLRLVNIDKIQILNNFIFSTNFYDSGWEYINVSNLRKMGLSEQPKHALAMRSLNEKLNPTLISNLKKDGWLPIVTRQVYLFNGFDPSRRDLQNDSKLMKNTHLEFKNPDISDVDAFGEVERLYNLLYLDKYTPENIQYTAAYIKELYEQGLMHLKFLYDPIKKINVGVVGMIGSDNVITTPVLGYDTSYEQTDGLYRICTLYASKYAADNNITLNASSGAPTFKTTRGGEPEIEYMFVYTAHLSLFKKLVWYMLSKISLNMYKHILQKNKL